MRYEKNRKIAGIDEYTLLKFMKMLILPAIVIVLIIVIVVADHLPKSGKKSPQGGASETVSADADSGGNESGETDSTGSAQADEGDNKEYINDFSGYGLKKNTLPEIEALIAEYQRAKLEGDAAAMYKVFGRTDTEGMAELDASLKEEMKVYDSYTDTVCYTGKGLSDGSFIVYISSKVKFDGIDTPAPMLTWAYILKNTDGSLYMKEPGTLTAEEQAYVDEISRSEDVRVLDSQMRTELAQAVVNDAKLAALYKIWADIPESPAESSAGTQAGQGAVQTESDASSEAAASAGSFEASEGTGEESIEEPDIHIEGAN